MPELLEPEKNEVIDLNTVTWREIALADLTESAISLEATLDAIENARIITQETLSSQISV